jgi:hypothetical protein
MVTELTWRGAYLSGVSLIAVLSLSETHPLTANNPFGDSYTPSFNLYSSQSGGDEFAAIPKSEEIS